ncbi:MAG: transporter [Desulfobacteraceae bacterium]|nr:transporter [Desulfobacteraceae bacterium]
MTRKTIVISIFSTLLLVAFNAFAQDASLENCSNRALKPVGQVNMTNGGVYAKGNMGIVLKTKYFKKNNIYSGNDEISDYTGKPSGTGAREQERLLTQMTARYGLGRGWDVRLMLPYWQKEMTRVTMPGGILTQNESSNDGLGDMVLMTRYRVLSQKQGSLFNLALGGGVKLPTGDTDELDELSSSNGCYGTGFQCGTGSWDPKFEIAFNKMIKNLRFDSTFMYTLTTEGDHDYECGDKFQYNFGSSLAINRWLDLQLEYNGTWQDKSKSNGAKVENSGGNRGYITPGVHLKFSRSPNIHFDVGMPILVFRDLNGEQLSEDYQIVCKLAFKF